MKKVCHITSVHNRYDLRILKKECVSLANAGYDVTLLCIDGKPEETYKNVRIVNINCIFKHRLNRILKTSKLLFKKAIEIDAEIYHLHDPELLNLAIKLKKHHKKVVFDSHEDVPSSIKEKKWIPSIVRNLASKVYEKKEKNIVKKIDAVISVTPHIVERLQKINCNTVMVTNYPILTELHVKEKQNLICFAGGISDQWLHKYAIAAINQLDGDVKYALAGDIGSDYFVNLQKEVNFNNVIVKGRIPYEEVAELYAESMAGIALNDYVANVGFHNGSIGNTKLFEYMAAGLPIICTDFELWKKIVQDEEIGICVEPTDVNQIAEAIRYLLNNKKEAEQMGIRARALAENKYNWDTQSKVLLDLYQKLG